MKLHELLSYTTKRKKRIGRGGKRGTYSGRGQKGQSARAGHKTRPAERDLFMRIPKLRGIKNKSRAEKSVIINVGDLERQFSELNLTKELFIKKGLMKKGGEPLKILGGGALSKAFTIQGISVSKAARKKIEAAHGKIL